MFLVEEADVETGWEPGEVSSKPDAPDSPGIL
jgi:hypothetical protein